MNSASIYNSRAEQLREELQRIVERLDYSNASVRYSRDLKLAAEQTTIDIERDNIITLFKEWLEYLQSTKAINSKRDSNGFRCNKNKYNKPYQRYKSEEFLFGIMHDDSQFLRFKDILAQRLTRIFPKSSKNRFGLLTDDLIAGDWSKLYTVTGYRPNMRGYAFTDASRLREESGLIPRIEEDPIAMGIGNVVTDLMLTFYSAEHVKNNKISRSGSPFMINDDGFKCLHYLYVMVHRSEITKLIKQKKYREIEDRFYIDMRGVVGSRFQSDGKGKVRFVILYKDALANNGKTVAVDNRVVIKGIHFEDFVTQRVRDVKGYNSVMNARLQSVTTCYLNGFLSAFPKAFKVRSAKDFATNIESSLNDFILRGEAPVLETSDVTQFDASMEMSFRKMIRSKINERLSSSAAFIESGLTSGAQFFPPVNDQETEGRWVGDPNDSWEYHEANYSLASGIATVTRDGRMNGTLSSLYTYAHACIKLGTHDADFFINGSKTMDSDEYRAVLRWVMSILEHNPEANMHLINFSDDQCRVFKSREWMDAYHNSPKLFNDVTEEFTQLVGYVPYVQEELSDGTVKIGACHNAITYVTNMLSPERGAQSYLKRNLGLGLSSRRDVYSDMPSYARINEILDSTFRECFPHFEGGLTQAIDAKYQMELDNLSKSNGIVNLSVKEAEILNNRDVLYYKYTAETDVRDVRPEILELVEGIKYPYGACYLELDSVKQGDYYRIDRNTIEGTIIEPLAEIDIMRNDGVPIYGYANMIANINQIRGL